MKKLNRTAKLALNKKTIQKLTESSLRKTKGGDDATPQQYTTSCVNTNCPQP